ncbi:hypothetical protein LOK49_LG01G04134 [Camellia lanceoleosa]|uniref:Uncharacterized protein n=1 Tax=Camellia lanceoleosa TaxID=1840588 RepID=A0ACC0IYZ2_9ERIC|nr:hypothetical protein LOK49_LG01G04134 [Camellia lanceoleosa]
MCGCQWNTRLKLWCNQLVVQVFHTFLSLIDPEAGQPFSDTQKRLAAFTKMLRSGMPLSSNWLRQSLLPQQATHDPVQHGKKNYWISRAYAGCLSQLDVQLFLRASLILFLVLFMAQAFGAEFETTGSNGKGHFVLVTNLVPCSGIRLHLWPEKGKSASDLPVRKRVLEVTQKMVHIPSGPAARQIETGSQTEQAPPSAVFFLAPGDMHGFRFLTISVAPSPTVSGRPPPAASMAVGQFFSPKDGELELSPQLLLLSTYSPKDIILKEDHPLAFNM